jgi:hypothetical protein
MAALELEQIDNEEILEENNEILKIASQLLNGEETEEDETASVESSLDGLEAGRVRAASATTRVFGHFMADKVSFKCT